jgi:hypothetical protein
MATRIPSLALGAWLLLQLPPAAGLPAAPRPFPDGPNESPAAAPSAGPATAAQATDPSAPAAALGFLFEINNGRAPEPFDHLLRLPQGWAALASDRLELSTRAAPPAAAGEACASAGHPTDASLQGAAAWRHLEIELVGARPGIAPQPEGRRGTWSSLRGRDPRGWTRAAATAERLRYAEVWPGIDVLYHSGPGGLRHDFCVAPGADPGAIRLRYAGIQRAEIAADGRLRLCTEIGELEESAPILTQETPAGTRRIDGGFVLQSHADGVLEIGFAVGPYDPAQTLVIDPYFSVFAHFGGSIFDSADALTSDDQGAWFVAGRTRSVDFPYADFGPGQPQSDDIFLLRCGIGGLVSETLILGGSGLDTPYDLAYRQDRVALVAASASPDLPILGATYQTQNLGDRDAYLAVFDADSLTLLWSSYLGGDQDDQGYSVAFASDGGVLLAGLTSSANFPALGPIDNGLTGTDAFVARFLADGSDLGWAGSYGAQTVDVGRAVAGAADGAAWLAGETEVDGDTQAFVVRIAPNGQLGAPLLYGGSGDESVADLLLDGAGGHWLLGSTASTDLQLAQAFSIGLEGSRDAFLMHRSAGGALDFSSYLGGPGAEDGIALASGISAIGGAVVHALLATGSSDLPLARAMSTLSKPSDFSPQDAYVCGIGPGPAYDLIYGSYLPCLDREFPRALQGGSDDRLLIAGGVIAAGRPADLPAAEPMLPTTSNGASAAFLCWIDLEATQTPGTVRFGALEDSVVLGESLRFHAYRVGGDAGADSAAWQLYDPSAKSFVAGYGGVLSFAAGQQIAEGTLLLPAGSFPAGAELFLVLEEPPGPVDLDSNFNIKDLTVLAGEPGGGGGGGGTGGDSGGSDCLLLGLLGPGHSERGLERLRGLRDRVLMPLPGGASLCAAYYSEGGRLLRWLEARPALRGAGAAAAFAFLWVVAQLEWLLLGLLLLRLVRRAPFGFGGKPRPDHLRAHPAPLALRRALA